MRIETATNKKPKSHLFFYNDGNHVVRTRHKLLDKIDTQLQLFIAATCSRIWHTIYTAMRKPTLNDSYFKCNEHSTAIQMEVNRNH